MTQLSDTHSRVWLLVKSPSKDNPDKIMRKVHMEPPRTGQSLRGVRPLEDNDGPTSLIMSMSPLNMWLCK